VLRTNEDDFLTLVLAMIGGGQVLAATWLSCH